MNWEPLTTLKGIGEKSEKLFANVGIYNLQQLLHYYPRDYDCYAEPVPLRECRQEEKDAVYGRIVHSPSVKGNQRKSVVVLELYEEPVRLQTSLESVAQGGKLLSSLFAYHGLYTGDPVPCTFEADWHLMSDIVDDFGKAAHLMSARQDLVTVEVTIPASAMKAWALKHAPLVKVTAPSYLVKEVKEAADGLCRLYGAP